jgi:DUF4097 and DUF4098 domain-containing protein YvlB
MKQNHTIAKTIYLILLTMITVICIIVGMYLHLAYRASGSRAVGSNQTVQTGDDALDDFNALKLDVDAGDVEIRYGSDFSISVEYPEKLLPTWSVENGTLIVKQSNAHVKWTDYNNSECDITVTLPEGTKLTSANIEMDMGNLEIYDIQADEMSVTANMGNIELYNIMTENLNMEADMGNIELKDCSVTDGTYEASMGNIELNGNFSSIQAQCDMGAISVTGDSLKDVRMDLDTSLGSIELNGKSVGTSYSN